MSPFYDGDSVTIYCGDMMEVLPQIDAEFTACVTDPPYGLEFMGRSWDHGVPGVSAWETVSKAMLPGAPLLAFGGTRKWHRLAVAIEDAGFELRDTLMWMYGGGFPKSLDISKAMDKRREEGEQIRRVTAWISGARDQAGATNSEIDDHFGFNGMAGHWTTQRQQAAVPRLDQWIRLVNFLEVQPPEEIHTLVHELNDRKGEPSDDWKNARVIEESDKVEGWFTTGDGYAEKETAKPEAQTWNGWGTALKPSWEPILLAMNPRSGTFAENALEHGVAGLNIDGCRIETDEEISVPQSDPSKRSGEVGSNMGISDADKERFQKSQRESVERANKLGRWPANLVLGEQAAEMVDGQSGHLESGSRKAGVRSGMGYHGADGDGGPAVEGNAGGASRFFYTAKATKRDRNSGFADVDNDHPTVKPSDLMKWLCRLVKMPERNHILDPFGGSGTTAYAAKELGMDCTIIEQEEEYCEIAAKRLRQQTLAL